MRRCKAPGYRVLVKLKPIEKQKEVVSKGGIITDFKTEKDLELEQQGMTEGYIIDVGPLAFTHQSGSKVPWCKKGDCVMIYKHSGMILDLNDGDNVYRMVQDLDIQAVFPDEGIEL